MLELISENPDEVAGIIDFLLNTGVLMFLLNLLPRKASRIVTEVFDSIVDVAKEYDKIEEEE